MLYPVQRQVPVGNLTLSGAANLSINSVHYPQHRRKYNATIQTGINGETANIRVTASTVVDPNISSSDPASGLSGVVGSYVDRSRTQSKPNIDSGNGNTQLRFLQPSRCGGRLYRYCIGRRFCN